jgi:hypothetical protein
MALRRKVHYLSDRGMKEKMTPHKKSGANIESVVSNHGSEQNVFLKSLFWRREASETWNSCMHGNTT